ncbi:MAG: GTP-binding protein, partial [Candidatus Lokiarchaeota archaeon]|nr:GTP-binding protein [Candidatus Lokiarchaeota archaeon]
TSAMYIVFDEKLGPTAQNWLPAELPAETRDKVPMMVMNIASNMDELPKGVAMIPVPAYAMKSLVRFVRFEDAKLRAGIGEAAIVLLFDEADDAAFYRYLKQFEDIFEKYAGTARELQEKKAARAHYTTMLSSFHDEVRGLLEALEREERTGGAFPSDEAEGEKAPFKCKIVVVGDPNVGKTSLVIQFTEKAFRKTYLPTIGVNITEKTIAHDGGHFTMILWDVAGQAKFTKMRKHFYSGASGVILVFDLTKKESLASIKDWHEDVKKSLEGAPLNCVLLGNKNDLADQRAISELEAKSMAAALTVPYFETSAKTGENVDKVFKHFAGIVMAYNALQPR